MDSNNSILVVPLEYAGIDVYHERRLGFQRRFSLTGDRLVIHSKKFLGDEVEIPIWLRCVDPVYAKLWKRSEAAGLGALILSAIFAFLLAFVIVHEGVRPPSMFGIIFDGGLSLICLVTGLRNIRRTEYASFGHSGGARFDIARRGPERAHFDEFVQRVVGRVYELRIESAATPKSIASSNAGQTQKDTPDEPGPG